jgi:hypothetical protein
MFGVKKKERGGTWSKALTGPFGAFKTWIPNDKIPLRFAVYRIPTYHDKNMIRDNSTGKLMCFADGGAISFPDAWMPEDHPQKHTNLDPEVNAELNVYAVCERLNDDHNLATHYVWGPGYKVGRFRLLKCFWWFVFYPLTLALAWWISSFYPWDFTREHPFIATGLTWIAISQVYGVAIMVVLGIAAVVETKQHVTPTSQ